MSSASCSNRRSRHYPRAELEDAFSGAASLTAPLLGRERARERRLSSLFPLSAGSLFPLLHAFYWLTANLAARGPFIAIVDNLRWADEQSVRWLLYLARRLEELPVFVVVAFRRGEPGASDLLDQVLADPVVVRLALDPLSEAAMAASLVAETFGREPDGGFTHACYVASGGNPLFFGELAVELAALGVPLTAEAVSALELARPGGLQRSVLLRLGRLPANARALANAVAVLGDQAELRHAAALASLDNPTALGAAEQLAQAEILDASMLLSFLHPLVRTAVYAGIPAPVRADEHGRAAPAPSRPTASRRSGLPRTSCTLTRSEMPMQSRVCGPQPWSLASAVRPRSRRGTWSGRCWSHARRSYAALLQSILGVAEARMGQGAWIAHLRTSLELTSDPSRRAVRALDLANALLALGSPAEAYDRLKSAIEDLRDAIASWGCT